MPQHYYLLDTLIIPLKYDVLKKKRDDYYCDCFRIGYKSIKSRIVFRVVTRHYVSRTKNKYAKANRKAHLSGHFTDNIERKYFRSALKRRLYNKMIYSKEIIVLGQPWGMGALPYKKLMGMCRWMGLHFHDWVDYSGVAFSKELLEWDRTFSHFWDKRVVDIYG